MRLTEEQVRPGLAVLPDSCCTLQSVVIIMKRNLFLSILANRSTRWGFISIPAFVWRASEEGNQGLKLADQLFAIHLSQTGRKAISFFSLVQTRKRLHNCEDKNNNLKTFNYNPDAICTPLVKPQTMSTLLCGKTCTFGDVCAFGTVCASRPERSWVHFLEEVMQF